MEESILKSYRNSIDEIDRNIVSLICNRMLLSRLIGQYKKEKNISILDTNRWNEVKENISDELELLSKHYHKYDEFYITNLELLDKIYEIIHEYSKKNQI